MILPTRFSDGIPLSLRLKLLTGLWVGLAALSVVLTLLLSFRLENAASVIEEAGNLKMQAYRLAYMAGEGSPRAQIDNQIAEFEKSLKRISQSDAIHPLIPSDNPLAYDLIQSMLIIDWQANILPPRCRHTAAPHKSSFTALPAISNCFCRRWKMPAKKTLGGSGGFNGSLC